ncbi:MAG: type II toxin-antitoxin system RelE/ParE family toxin [Verrucomicrobiota bacterium]
MDYKVVWTLRSREDLRNIAVFIARDNSAAALRLGDLIFQRVDSLQNFPELGRIVPERSQPTTREIVVGNYRIVYRVRHEQKTIEILRVWHGARGVPEL